MNPRNIQLSILDRVLLAILREDGCFVTSRMLCRRYSALFKSHNVVAAMKFLSRPMEAEDHVGVFRCLNEKSKVFYKCPPNMIRPDNLQRFSITPAQYKEGYCRMPKSRGMRGTCWDSFIKYVLENSPYGPVDMSQFVQPPAEEDGEDPAGDPYQEFELQRFIMHCDGAFVSSRILCRRITKAYRVANVIRAMKCMSRPRESPHYVGQFVRVSERVKVFFKCPPRMLGSEALELYGLTPDDYHKIYFGSPRPLDGSVSNWDSYVESVMSCCPYSITEYPLQSFEVDPSIQDKISQMLSPSPADLRKPSATLQSTLKQELSTGSISSGPPVAEANTDGQPAMIQNYLLSTFGNRVPHSQIRPSMVDSDSGRNTPSSVGETADTQVSQKSCSREGIASDEAAENERAQARLIAESIASLSVSMDGPRIGEQQGSHNQEHTGQQ